MNMHDIDEGKDYYYNDKIYKAIEFVGNSILVIEKGADYPAQPLIIPNPYLK